MAQDGETKPAAADAATADAATADAAAADAAPDAAAPDAAAPDAAVPAAAAVEAATAAAAAQYVPPPFALTGCSPAPPPLPLSLLPGAVQKRHDSPPVPLGTTWTISSATVCMVCGFKEDNK